MRAYLSIFKLRFITGLQYRVAAIAGLLTQICFGFMYILMFKAFYENGNIPANFSYTQMITYLWLQQAFFMYFMLFTQDKDITKSIIEGDVSYELVRPINLYNKWYATLYSSRLAKTLIRMLPLIVFAFCLPKIFRLSLPVSVGAFMLFLVALILGGFLVTALTMMCYAVLFKTMSAQGTFSIFAMFGAFCSGAMLPIPMMPLVLQKILNYTPFRYMNDLCFRIYCGSIDLKSAAIQIGIQIAWIVVLILIGKLIFMRNIKTVEVQGG